MSMGGNEFIGSIDGILKSRPDLSSRNPDDYLDEGWIRYIIYMLDHCFRKVINDVRSVSDFSDLPIFFHGYEYVFPYPWGILDNRSPTYVKRDHFIGQHFENRGVNDRYTRKLVCDRIIDITCDVVKGAINTYGDRNVHFVDLRNTLHDQNDWFDEIHPTYHGAQQLAAIFSKEIKRHLPSS